MTYKRKTIKGPKFQKTNLLPKNKNVNIPSQQINIHVAETGHWSHVVSSSDVLGRREKTPDLL